MMNRLMMLRSVRRHSVIDVRIYRYINTNNTNNTNNNHVSNTSDSVEKKKKETSWLKRKVGIYGELSKFRLSSLVVLTTGAGFLCAGGPIEWGTMASACFGTALCAASAGTFNQIFEVERDFNMKRTRNRPLPSGRVSMNEAITWGITSGAAGTGLLLANTNPVVAALGIGNIILYAGPYTYSKQKSEINTWIGSVVGAIPPIMGWAAATGSVIAAEPAALASILFLWQFPHFFSLSWLHREDYARGDFQMVAVNDPVGTRSANLIMEYSLYLSAIPILSSAAGLTTWMFAVEGTAANIYLLSLARKFQNEKTNANARKVFLCSLWYLPVLLAAYVFHSRMWLEDESESTDKMTEVVTGTKEVLKGYCVHEIIAYPKASVNTKNDDDNSNNNNTSNDTANSSHLCMKIKADKTIEAATEVVVSTASKEIPSLVIKKENDNQTKS